MWTRKAYNKGVGLKKMTPEEKRTYAREAQRRHREKMLKLNPPKGREKLQKPEIWNCTKCGYGLPYTENYFRPSADHAWGLAKRCYRCESRNAMESSVRRKYGMKLEEYEELMKTGCGICGKKAKRMAMDHCHTFGNVRGPLCQSCNNGLGMFGDDPERMEAAAEYVRRHKLFA